MNTRYEYEKMWSSRRTAWIDGDGDRLPKPVATVYRSAPHTVLRSTGTDSQPASSVAVPERRRFPAFPPDIVSLESL